MAELPAARKEAGTVMADVLVAEATAVVGALHATALPQEMALVGALVKYVVPATADTLFRDATRLLGARSQLIGIAGAGAFEKAMRDNRVVGIFDGNSIVNLNVIINEFASIARPSRREMGVDELLGLLDPGSPARSTDFGGLRLVTRCGSSLLAAVPELVERVVRQASSELVETLGVFAGAASEVMARVGAAPHATVPDPASFDLAGQVAEVFAGAACVAVAARNTAATQLGGKDVWLTAALGRVCARLGRRAPRTSESCMDLYEQGMKRHLSGDPVSLFEGWAA